MEYRLRLKNEPRVIKEEDALSIIKQLKSSTSEYDMIFTDSIVFKKDDFVSLTKIEPRK